MAGRHTIILLQYTPRYETRTYLDFPAVAAAMDAVVKLYEHKLKELNPQVRQITYDIADLNNYLDTLQDVCALVFDPASNKYEPKDRAWIKQKIFLHLKGQA
mmetsp:Transcript_6684/g.14274  ORF Transcript_6684/g.14274 Transcript_6684/m.14274 type:complete len:102 (+) Transcript_6684:43-348(+)